MKDIKKLFFTLLILLGFGSGVAREKHAAAVRVDEADSTCNGSLMELKAGKLFSVEIRLLQKIDDSLGGKNHHVQRAGRKPDSGRVTVEQFPSGPESFQRKRSLRKASLLEIGKPFPAVM